VAAFTVAAGTGLTSDLVATFNRVDWLVQQSDTVDTTRSATYGYDLAGNLTDKVKGALVRQLRWSYRNTLTAALQGPSATELVEVGRYDYDADLQRVKRTTANEQVEYVLDERYVLQEATAAAGHPSYRRYHYGTGPLLVDDAAGRRFISTDALGSTTDLTTAAAAVASMRKYDAWGQYRNDTAPATSDPKLGFTGHQYDPETGLVYARARYYDADLGRFISLDSLEGEIGDAPSLHRYAYVRQNPLRYTDPTGHQFATSCDTPTGAPACAAATQAMGEGAAAGTASATAAPAAGATTSTGVAGAGTTTATATSAAGATSSTAAAATAGEAAAVPWWKVMAASLVGAVLGDKPAEMTPEQRRQAADEEARRISQTTRDLTGKGVAVVAEGPDGQVVVPIREPGTPQPQRAPGRDPGKVITEPEKSQPMSAPGTRGAPQLAPGEDQAGTEYSVSGIWTPGKVKDPAKNADVHWKKHGAEFPEYGSKGEYIEGAREFLNSPPPGALTKTRATTGEVVVYDPVTNTFGIRTADGTPATLFRPDPAKHGYPTNVDYFNAQ
jgi:RHS repeat-associated protein